MNLEKVYSIRIINENEAELCIYENKFYKLTSAGELFNAKNKKLKFNNNGKGYLSFHFSAKSKYTKRLYIHRLVGEAFLLPIKDKTHINHKDGNKSNNCVENLEWCNQLENNRHAWKNGLCNRLLNAKEINQYDLNGNFLKTWESATEAAIFYNCTDALIAQAANKNVKTCVSAKNFLWEYIIDKGKGFKQFKNYSILQFDLSGNFIQEFNSPTIAAKNTGVNISHIICVCKGKRKKAKGFIWKYKETD